MFPSTSSETLLDYGIFVNAITKISINYRATRRGGSESLSNSIEKKIGKKILSPNGENK